MNTSGTIAPCSDNTPLSSRRAPLERRLPCRQRVRLKPKYTLTSQEEGEIATRFTIPGLNQARQQEVYAQSKDPMTGGTKSTYKVTKTAIDAVIAAAKNASLPKRKLNCGRRRKCGWNACQCGVGQHRFSGSEAGRRHGCKPDLKMTARRFVLRMLNDSQPRPAAAVYNDLIGL